MNKNKNFLASDKEIFGQNQNFFGSYRKNLGKIKNFRAVAKIKISFVLIAEYSLQILDKNFFRGHYV